MPSTFKEFLRVEDQNIRTWSDCPPIHEDIYIDELITEASVRYTKTAGALTSTVSNRNGRTSVADAVEPATCHESATPTETA